MDYFDFDEPRIEDFEESQPEIIFNSKNHIVNPVDTDTPLSKNESSGINFQYVRKKKVLTEKRRKELEKLYQTVVVHDYGDEYHLSEEERQKKSKYYDAFNRLRKCKRKFRKLDEYVKVYRLAMNCLRLVANDNGIYDPEKFMRMAIKGQIEVFGLTFPKYIGKDKKDINWEYVSEFILDESKDPSELVMTKYDMDDDYDDESLESIFEPEVADRIMNSIESSDDEDKVCKPIYDEVPDGYAVLSDKKETKQLLKSNPEILNRIKEDIKHTNKKLKLNNRLNNMYLYNMDESDFEIIEEMDRKRGFNTSGELPVFKGDIMNRSDYKKYLYELEEYEKNNIQINYDGKMRTQAEIDEIELKMALERDGWNIRNLYRQKDKEKKLKKARKRDKQREKELTAKLLKIQERQKKRSGKSGNKEVEFDSKKSKKKKKKSKKEDD